MNYYFLSGSHLIYSPSLLLYLVYHLIMFTFVWMGLPQHNTFLYENAPSSFSTASWASGNTVSLKLCMHIGSNTAAAYWFCSAILPAPAHMTSTVNSKQIPSFVLLLANNRGYWSYAVVDSSVILHFKRIIFTVVYKLQNKTNWIEGTKRYVL